jgi:hypothetical protein
MKQKYTPAPGVQVFINGQEPKLTPRQVVDTILSLNLPLCHLKKIANAFGGYIEVKLKPKKKSI